MVNIRKPLDKPQNVLYVMFIDCNAAHDYSMCRADNLLRWTQLDFVHLNDL